MTTRTTILAAALALGACNSSPTHTVVGDLGLTRDGGTQDDAYVGPQMDAGSGNDAYVASGNDAGCTAPGTLHAPPTGTTMTLYCPFSGTPAVSCDPSTQHCCEGTTTGSASSCSPTATPCAAGQIDWQCEDPVADCTGATHCCGIGTFMLGGTGCANYASHFTGTHCASACASGEITMCTNDNECPAGQHCTPFKTHGNQVGACQ
jgi:hypothetical protein